MKTNTNVEPALGGPSIGVIASSHFGHLLAIRERQERPRRD